MNLLRCRFEGVWPFILNQAQSSFSNADHICFSSSAAFLALSKCFAESETDWRFRNYFYILHTWSIVGWSRELMMKHSRFFTLFVVLGVVLLATYEFSVAKENQLIAATPEFDITGLFLPLFAGTAFLTAGICGIGIESFNSFTSKTSKAAYSVLVLLVAFLGSLTLCYVYFSFSTLEVCF